MKRTLLLKLSYDILGAQRSELKFLLLTASKSVLHHPGKKVKMSKKVFPSAFAT